jgi:hypothetical protein
MWMQRAGVVLDRNNEEDLFAGDDQHDAGEESEGRAGDDPAADVDAVIEADRFPVRRNLTGRYQGIYTRRTAHRISVEAILHRAQLLPRIPRAIVCAHFDAGMPVKELAMLHHTTPLKMWRCLNHWRDTISDPAFLLAAKFRDRLPHELEVLAQQHWIEGRPLREIAAARRTTMHEVRKKLARGRSMLLLFASREGKAAVDSVRRLM